MWKDRIVDHLCRTNRHWRVILEQMQKWPGPITREWLMTQSHAGYGGWEISEILEGFLIEYLSDSLYKRRTQLCGGVPGNGLEMWRWLYLEFQGGSEAVMLGGSRRLQDWPRCNKMDQLSQHLDDWTECLQTYGSELLAAPGILRTMLLGIIPTELEDELLSKPHVKTWQEIINWCKIKTVYRRQKVLSEAARRPGGRINSLIIDHPDDKEDEPEKNGSAAFDESQPPQWFLDHINALSGKGKGGGKGDRNSRRDTKGGGKGKGVRITFKGCWHCGDEKHSRGKCPEFQKLLADFNKGKVRTEWKLPQNYAGKYELAKKKAQAASKKRVNMLDGASDVDTEGDEWEDSDIDIMGPSMGQAFQGPTSVLYSYSNLKFL